jgi:hypothetical protein
LFINNNRWIKSKGKASTYSSTSSFIAGYGSNKPANGINSTLVSSLDSSSADEVKKRFYDSSKSIHVTADTRNAHTSNTIYGGDTDQPNYNVIDKSFIQQHQQTLDPKYYKVEMHQAANRRHHGKNQKNSDEDNYSSRLSTFGRTLRRDDSCLSKNYVNLMNPEGFRDDQEIVLDSAKLSSACFLFEPSSTATPPVYSDLEASCYIKYLKSVYEERLAKESGFQHKQQTSQADLEAMATRIFPRTNPKFRTATTTATTTTSNMPRVKSVSNLINESPSGSSSSFYLEKTVSTSSSSSPETHTGSTRRLFQNGSGGIKFVDVCSKL